MPELPEVENVVRSIAPRIKGKKIILATDISGKNLRENVTTDDLNSLSYQIITDVIRRGKYVLITLSSGDTFIVHLGMTGVLSYEPSGYSRHNHQHLEINLDNGDFISYRDPRRFGMLSLSQDIANNKYILNCGVEPLTSDFTPEYFYSHSNKSRKNIKQFLMTNKILVGVGNIYASEILFISRISPIRIASSLSRDEIKSVVENTKSVLEESIIKGGTTFRDYRSADNSKGGFQDELLVYGQNTCKVCESELQKITQGQRSTFFCENCQK